ncbi:MAG TPA: four helix bundle protein [Patescibacteria group bacterium]|nr:four helix bundle protein [Patescibacteria group bacterium]
MRERQQRNKELENRLVDFSKKTIDFSVKIPKTAANVILIKQLIRSGTSIAANYMEACETLTSKEFVHKISISKKESRETIFWLNLISHANKEMADESNQLAAECGEFLKIFRSIISKFRN